MAFKQTTFTEATKKLAIQFARHAIKKIYQQVTGKCPKPLNRKECANH